MYSTLQPLSSRLYLLLGYSPRPSHVSPRSVISSTACVWQRLPLDDVTSRFSKTADTVACVTVISYRPLVRHKDFSPNPQLLTEQRRVPQRGLSLSTWHQV